MDAKLTKSQDDLGKTVKEMTERAGSSGAFARIYAIYQKLQTERFKTENASQGNHWPDLDRNYSEYKKKKFKSYPGNGNKMLIATSTLAGAVIGPGPHGFYGVEKHRALFGKFSMQISVEESGTNKDGKPFTYPSIVSETRPFMDFNEASMKEMQDALSEFVLGF